MKYNILIHYKTGDSFKTEEKETLLDGSWEDINILKRNINRIQEHYEWYIQEKEYRYQKVFVVEPVWHRGHPETSVLFETDDGTEYWQSAFWCGYFESLYGARAVLEKEEEIGFGY